MRMRFIFFSLLTLILTGGAAQAQSVADEIPSVVDLGDQQVDAPVQAPSVPAVDLYTVTDVNADVTADHSGHARDQALTQAERTAFAQLCTRLNVPAERVAKFSDDDIAALVQSFDLQSERLSAVRYIGVFTLHFKQAAVQKKIGKYAGTVNSSAENPVPVAEGKVLPSGPLSHVMITVQTPSLAVWTQIKRRLNDVPQIAKMDVISLGRGASRIDLSYAGSIGDLEQAVTAQGLVLRQASLGDWTLTEGSMIAR